MRIFLDDIRNPYDVFILTVDPLYEKNESWEIIRSHDEFIECISAHGVPKLVSFDHDLDQGHYLPENQTAINYSAMDVKCGYHSLKWLIEYCYGKGEELPEIIIHSQNIEGKKNMESLLQRN